jgi:hypothetical protein
MNIHVPASTIEYRINIDRAFIKNVNFSLPKTINIIIPAIKILNGKYEKIFSLG